VLSPYVWREDGNYLIALRAVNHSENAKEKVARIYFGKSGDGLTFQMDDEPNIAPGAPSEDDDGGCEDPTVLRDGGKYYVFYTGWNREREQARLLLAVGDDLAKLQKSGRVFPDGDEYRNTKEATLVRVGDEWLMFYECSDGERSLIGMAQSSGLNGPWRRRQSICDVRKGKWDGYHLSTGPVAFEGSQRTVMF